MFGVGNSLMFTGNSIDTQNIDSLYRAMGGYFIPKKASYKSLAYCLIVKGYPVIDGIFSQTYAIFLTNLLASPEFRRAAADAFWYFNYEIQNIQRISFIKIP